MTLCQKFVKTCQTVDARPALYEAKAYQNSLQSHVIGCQATPKLQQKKSANVMRFWRVCTTAFLGVIGWDKFRGLDYIFS